MRVEPDAVEQDYRREERREHKAMESELPGAKFIANTLSRAFDDNRSVGSVCKVPETFTSRVVFPMSRLSVAGNLGFIGKHGQILN